MRLGWVLLLAGCGRIGFGEHVDAAAGDGTPIDSTGAPLNRAFISTTSITGSFGGLTGGDGLCQQLATQQGLGGSWIALLGDSTTTPGARVTGSRGWVDLGGTPIVDDPTEWFSGAMRHPLMRDETGTFVGPSPVWAGTAGGNCTDWSSTGSSGTAGIVVTSSAFNNLTIDVCFTTHSFACVEHGPGQPLPIVPVVGRLVFVTAGAWLPSGGVAGANAACQSEATAASLPGTFIAALITSTGDQLAALSTTGPTWVRRDGVAIGATAADVLGTSVFLDSFTNQAANGDYVEAASPWTGTATVNCNDWTSSASTAKGEFGDAVSAYRANWRDSGNDTCDVARRLVCFQQ